MGVEGEGAEGDGGGERSCSLDKIERGGDGVTHCWLRRRQSAQGENIVVDLIQKIVRARVSILMS